MEGALEVVACGGKLEPEADLGTAALSAEVEQAVYIGGGIAHFCAEIEVTEGDGVNLVDALQVDVAVVGAAGESQGASRPDVKDAI